jgi:DNA repair protein RadC
MDEQLVLIQGVQSRKRQAAEVALIRLRKIHEELNSIYGSHPSQRPIIHTPADTAELLAPFMDHLDHEELWVILLDIKNRVKKLVKLYQ